jgi:hypothetical protein
MCYEVGSNEDGFESLSGVGILEVADLSLEEPQMKSLSFEGGDEDVKTSRTYWLILVDRLNTKSMLRRRHLNIQDSDACVLCNTREVETIEHLFFDCPFAKDCWTAIHVDWDASFPLQDRFNQARLSSNLPFFTEATLIAAWEL